ncbi:hypothetical protein L249_0007 [Ophiocordyceps polyrhachis-furcata BCC 54312]|uniref:Gag1-like clamp domain-containing protein n=1 Tax=Ophiocordyceps polyrhachis-furcata BCC 54312 TaxID=1330021 RepID=A0A367LCW8_9HYPO|nr:hypothetical protein L249_0007 [Ophiocordyceps polyrhachis-furcata BCC 54312]
MSRQRSDVSYPAFVLNGTSASLPASSTSSKFAMIFSDFYKSPRSPLAKLLHSNSQPLAQSHTATPDWATAEYADLLSRDKTRQKEAIRRYLYDKVRSDWEFNWPQQPPGQSSPITEGPAASGSGRQSTDNAVQVQDETRDDAGYQVDAGSPLEEPPSQPELEDEEEDDDDARSTYSIVSEDAIHYRPRIESTSDLSDDEPSSPARISITEPLRLASKTRDMERKARRRRALREEMTWNDGLACFEARRNAWTGARTVRVRSKPISPSSTSPKSPRRFLLRHSMSGSPPTSANSVAVQSANASTNLSEASSLVRDTDRELNKHQTRESTTSDPASTEAFPVETLVPVGLPLLPPSNSMRATITPAVYSNLYDKVVLNNVQPSCPINLSDMLRSCVAGWKRDGEWPPRPAVPDPTVSVRRSKKASSAGGDCSGSVAHRMSFGLLSRDKDDDGRTSKGFRRSLQKAFGLGVGTGNGEFLEGGTMKER